MIRNQSREKMRRLPDDVWAMILEPFTLLGPTYRVRIACMMLAPVTHKVVLIRVVLIQFLFAE